MNFKLWLEGFGVDIDREKFDSNLLGDTNNRQNLVQTLYRSNFFDFSPEDRPQDFIKINVINELKVLRPSSKLQSFRSEILYGLQFSINSELKLKLLKEKNKLGQELSNLEQRKLDLEKNGTESMRKLVFDTYNDILSKGVSEEKFREFFPQIVQSRLKRSELLNRQNSK